MQAAKAAKKTVANVKTSISSKREYGDFIWENTTEQNGFAFSYEKVHRVPTLTFTKVWVSSTWNKF